MGLFALQGVPFDMLLNVVALAGTVVLLLILVAFGGIVYRSVFGDGIDWPEDDEEPGEDGVRRGSNDEEWKYY